MRQARLLQSLFLLVIAGMVVVSIQSGGVSNFTILMISVAVLGLCVISTIIAFVKAKD